MQNWKPMLSQFTFEAINLQIDALKQRIREDQQEIIILTVLRMGIKRAHELRAISDKRASEAIDEAIAQANAGSLPEITHVDGEGAIR